MPVRLELMLSSKSWLARVPVIKSYCEPRFACFTLAWCEGVSQHTADAVMDAVLNTGLHRVADDRARYSVAALVEPTGVAYCCCCWLYVAVTR
jgi:hypothetical protein